MAAVGTPMSPPIRFRRRLIADEPYEAAGVADIDGDGIPDIVSGAWWYPGPDFTEKHRICDVKAFGGWHDDFSAILLDVDHDGYIDVVTGGFWGGTLRWRRNPSGVRGEPWDEFDIAPCVPIETTRAWDIDGDGQLDLVPNTPGRPQQVIRLVGASRFEAVILNPRPTGHGLGFGDIDGDGQGELILSDGYLDPPEAGAWSGEWTFVPGPDLGTASVPILIEDIDGDGVTEMIVGNAHGYGLDWWSRTELSSDASGWQRHPIDPHNGQYHDLWWGDLDGDGLPELVTGKRYRAHLDGDPGAHDPVGLYYFKWTGEGFAKQIIAHGEPRSGGKGTGIAFCVADLTGDGRPDIVAPGIDGLEVFFNLGTNPGVATPPATTPR